MAYPRHKKYPFLRADVIHPRSGYKTKRGYIYDSKTGKKLTFDTGCTNATEAKKRLELKIEEIYGNGQSIDDIQKYQRPMTLSRVLDAYMKDYIKNNGTKKTERRNRLNIQNQKSQCNILLENMGDVPIKSLDKETIDKYIDKRLEKVKPSSVQREIKILKAAINKLPLAQAKFINERIHGHKKFKNGEDILPRDAFIEPEHYDCIINECEKTDPKLTLIYRIMHFVGARGDEIKYLKWHEIKWKYKRIDLPPERTKEHKAKSMFIDETLLNELVVLRDNCKVDKKGNPVNENVFLHNNKPITETYYLRVWHDACEICGLLKYEKGKRISRYLPHDLRHTRVVLNEMSNIPRNITMLQTGHQSQATYDWYDTPSRIQQQKIVELQKEAEAKLKAELKAEMQKNLDSMKDFVETKRDEAKVWSSDEIENFLDDLVNKFDDLKNK